MNTLVWEVPLFVLGSLFFVRLIIVPYWLHLQDREQATIRESALIRERDEAVAALSASKTSPSGPKVVPIRFGEKQGSFRGLFVRNFGEPAYELSIPDVAITSRCYATFNLKGQHYSTFTANDGEAYFEVWTEEQGKPSRAGALFEAMQENSIPSIVFPMKYKDFAQQWFVTDVKIEVDVGAPGGLSIGHLGRHPIVPDTTSDKPPRPENFSQEWKELAEKFGAADRFVRAAYQCHRQNNTTVYEKWDVNGGHGNAEAASLCRYAGALLLKSMSGLSDSVVKQSDSANSWFFYLKEYCAALEYGHLPAVGVGDDGTKTIYILGSINSLMQVSAIACRNRAADELSRR